MKKDGKIDCSIRFTDPTSSHNQVDPKRIKGRDAHVQSGDIYLKDMKNVEYFERGNDNKNKKV